MKWICRTHGFLLPPFLLKTVNDVTNVKVLGLYKMSKIC